MEDQGERKRSKMEEEAVGTFSKEKKSEGEDIIGIREKPRRGKMEEKLRGK